MLTLFICLSEIRFLIKNATTRNNTFETEKRKKDTFEQIEKRMVDRLKYIREICNNEAVQSFKTMFQLKAYQSTLFTVNGTGICACKVPKASSTFFGKVLLLLRDRNKTKEIKRLSGFDIHGRMFSTYGETCDTGLGPSFFVSRNPYTRLFSGYIDKIFIPKFWKLALSLSYFMNDIRKTQNIRVSEYSEKEIAKGNCYKDDVSFEMFLRYVADTKQMDPHFTPVTMLCDPCKHNYTAIIKQENMKEETMYMLERFGVEHEVQSDIEPLLEEELVERSVQNLLDTVRMIIHSAETMHGCKTPLFVYLRVWQAMQILGYVDMAEPFPAGVFSEGLKGAYKKLKQHGIVFLNSTQRKTQRQEYLKLSYQSVSFKILKRIQRLFQLDFLMFDYNITPPGNPSLL